VYGKKALADTLTVLKEEKTSKNQFLGGTLNVVFTGSEAGGAS
jgi:hypothetical protein